ncbi:hypothetical protein NDU88_002369 [Pleurodeles waltl]|uniref:Uncharacterized protein n=1 Tax=Pleurodeles waltl TaxID=8319 RepID=A0AAV7VAD3_PLEWA|nr:hypothetical protein NDU88_002369 [Pleurodeles waltl]
MQKRNLGPGHIATKADFERALGASDEAWQAQIPSEEKATSEDEEEDDHLSQHVFSGAPSCAGSEAGSASTSELAVHHLVLSDKQSIRELLFKLATIALKEDKLVLDEKKLRKCRVVNSMGGLTVGVWKDAATQIFYSYCIAWGGLVTLSSYNKFNNNCYLDSILVCCINGFTSLFAGFAIFAILGHMAHVLGKPVSKVVESGFGLAFIAYPEALTRLPISPLWSILFFLMLLTLGFDSQFSNVEILLTSIQDAIPEVMRRFRIYITSGCCMILFLLGIPCVTQAGIYWVSLIDYYCGGWTLLIAALLELVAITWIYGKQFCSY